MKVAKAVENFHGPWLFGETQQLDESLHLLFGFDNAVIISVRRIRLPDIDIGSIMSLPRAVIAVFGLYKGGRNFVNLSAAPLHVGTFSFL